MGESEEMVAVQQEDLKRKLRANYAATLHALVATRGVLLQAIPLLSVVSIFASTMSSTPILMHSQSMTANLPEMLVSSPFAEARAQEQELIDEQEWIRRANLTEDQNCVPNPKIKKLKGLWAEYQKRNGNKSLKRMLSIRSECKKSLRCHHALLMNGLLLLTGPYCM